MPNKPIDDSAAKIPVRHAAEEALKELEALAEAWVERQRQRLNAAN